MFADDTAMAVNFEPLGAFGGPLLRFKIFFPVHHA
jgi:hypothetical protein